MKVAVLKLGSRITLNAGTSGGTGETLAIIQLLLNAGYKVDAYTKLLSKDIKPFTFNIFDIESNFNNLLENNYDALIVLNGNVNYFGGQDDKAQTLNYYIINHFKGPVFYILCDCNLLLKQIWPSIESKAWSSCYKKEDIEITRDDIVYISQPRNTSETIQLARKYVNIKDCVHFPFEQFPLITSDSLTYNRNNTTYDLLYGGTFRNGRREDDMIKFYFGLDDYKVGMFGNIEEKHFNKSKIENLSKPIFEKAVPYNWFNQKMNNAKATVIIGDKLYKKLDDLAQRIYECIKAGVVVLLDASYDYNKRVFKDKELVDFCYVNSREDVKDRLEKLKDADFRKHIVDLQIKDTAININEYSNALANIIGGYLCH